MNTFFAALGDEVFTRWKKENFDPEVFPALSVGALRRRPPSRHVNLDALIREFLLNDSQPPQTRSAFGQPELVVYENARFYIQVLFWLEGTMEIHQHTFSGAFHVLAGSSLHAEFAFEKARPVSAHLRVGDLRLQSADLLRTGATVPIRSGADHIHSLFHLDTPSVSVVVRTQEDPGTGPQFSYLPPHLAVDPFFEDSLTARRRELLEVLERTGDPCFAPVVLEMLRELDFERGFFVLQSAMDGLRARNQWDAAWRIFRKKHGSLADYAGPTLEEIAWRDGPVGLRASVTETSHRFFLALLLNVPDRKEILRLVAKRHGSRPVETILRWARELSEVTAVGTWILDAEFPVEVCVPQAGQLDVFLGALRYFLEGGGTASFGGFRSSAADVENFRAAFARSSLRALSL